MSIRLKINGTSLSPSDRPIEASSDENVRTIEISNNRSSDAESIVLDIQDDDLTTFHFDDGTVWFTQTDEIPELFSNLNRSDGSYELKSYLEVKSNDRSIPGKIFIKLVEIFKPKLIEESALNLAKKMEKQVLENEGLNFIDAEFNLTKFDSKKYTRKSINADRPFLLFLHGTGSSTKGSFSELVGCETWSKLVEKYGSNIIGLEHRTWSESPLQNALDVMENIPDNAVLHMISHSRGGLVGDVLCRCGNVKSKFTAQEIGYLESLEDDRSNDVKNMKALNVLIESKNITVEKFVRVACPAAGTTILSKRLDIYLNVIMNLVGYGLGQKINPIFKGIKSFLEAVIDERNDPAVLPGLEAMIPDSPFQEIINSSNIKTDTQLRVVAGNAAGGGVKATLGYILTRLYYWHDNDYVVDTDSMFLGAVPAKDAYYHFVTGSDVNHFNYFKNKDSQESIYDALTIEKGEDLKQFKLLKRGERNRALVDLPGGEVLQLEPEGKKPVVILLPGIMGSNLYDEDEVVWINFTRMAFGFLKKLDMDNENVSAKSLVDSSYGKFVRKLRTQYDVVDFPYDWRKSLSEAGSRLNDKINKLLDLDQPIRLIGHSMGGLVIRDFMIRFPDTWKLLSQKEQFRCLLLGTPWRGSYLIPEIITGVGPMIKKLNKLALFQSKKRLLQIFSRYEGLLELLPLFGHDFEDMELWKALHKVTKGKGWVLPEQEKLDKFKAYKQAIRKALGDNGLAPTVDLKKVFYIVGKDNSTVSNLYFYEKRKGRNFLTQANEIAGLNPKKNDLEFDITGAGDGSVPWEPTINGFHPENIYYMDTIHGEMANDEAHFDALIELLSTGNTRLLSQSRPLINDVKSRGVLSSDHILSNDPYELVNDILGLKSKKEYEITKSVTKSQLKVSIKSGHLKYSNNPLIIGHFKDDGIVSAEYVMNFLLKGQLAERHSMGLYPGEIGTSLVILPGEDNDLGTVIAGLGDPDKLTPFRLSQSIEMSCLEYVFTKKDAKQLDGKPLGISSLLIGSAYGHLPLSDSVGAILEGVMNANIKIRQMNADLPIIDQVEFIELYHQKALNAFHVLNQMEEGNNMYNISLQKSLRSVEGVRSNMPIQNEVSWWIRITALLQRNKSTGAVSFEFNASSGRARVSSRELFTSQTIIDSLLAESSHDNKWDRELAKTMFEMLVPNDMKMFFRNQQNILLILDKDTSKYPWELLHYDSAAAKPICTSSGMIRQLITRHDRKRLNLVSELKALIIGDPLLSGSDLPQLPAAEQEAKMVETLLKENRFETVTKIRKPYKDIIKKVYDEYKIMHIASHGVVDYGPQKRTGILLSDNVILGSAEINQISSCPELVFINSCFMGQIDPEKEAHFRNKHNLAANIGTQFIENGAKAVVVAGWAVNDSAALIFADEFYKNMLNGATFADAVKSARSVCYDKYGSTNTWGAYHAYGDPFYKLVKGRSNGASTKRYFSEIEALTELELFVNDAKDSRKRGETAEDRIGIQRWLESISSKISISGYNKVAKVVEKEAEAYGEIELYNIAISKYESLMKINRAEFTFRSLEQLNNLRVVAMVKKKLEIDDQLLNKKITKADAKRKVDQLKQISEFAIKELKDLRSRGETYERLNLLGSAYKRSILLETSFSKMRKAMEEMAAYYKRAFLFENEGLKKMNIYPLTNWLTAETLLLLDYSNKAKDEADKIKKEEEKINEIEKILGTNILDFLNKKEEEIDASSSKQDDLWDLIEFVNVNQLKLFYCNNKNEVAEILKNVIDNYKKAWRKSGSHRTKNSEIDHVLIVRTYLNAIPESEVEKARTTKKRNVGTHDLLRFKKSDIIKRLKVVLDDLHLFYTGLN